jgi:hypothetical protein
MDAERLNRDRKPELFKFSEEKQAEAKAEWERLERADMPEVFKS